MANTIFVPNHNVMNQLGNLLASNEVFLDAAHPIDDSPHCRDKYVPPPNNLCLFVDFPPELTWKIFSMATYGDYSTQSMLYYVLKGSKALHTWAPKLIFDTENEFQTVISSHFMDQQSSSAALKIILNGYHACRSNFRTAFLLMCDSLCQNYVTLFNWQITNLKSSYILCHQILNAVFGSETAISVTKTETQVLTYESKEYLEKRKRLKAEHDKLVNSFDPFMDEEERKAKLARLEEEFKNEQELEYRTMTVAKEARVPKHYQTIFNFDVSDNVYLSSNNKLSQVYTGLLVSSLLAPLVGPRVDFSSNIASMKTEMQSKPAWEWSFFDDKLRKLLANRKIQLSNIFDLCDTEWNDLLQGDSSSSIFARTHGPVNADQIHTHASLVSFLLRKGNVPEELWWPCNSKHEDKVNPIFELSLMTIQAGNIQLLKYLYTRGWFAMPKCPKSTALITNFPNLINREEVWCPTENEIILYQTLVQSVFKNRRYQSHTFNRTDLWSYQTHVKTMMDLLYSLVEPYYYLDTDTKNSKQDFYMRAQAYLGQDDGNHNGVDHIEMPATILPQALSYMRRDFTTMDIIGILVNNDQWDLIQWLGKMLTPFCQSKEAAKVFKSRNAYMLRGQLWIAYSVLKAIKNHPAKARCIAMLEWTRTNLYDQFRTIGQETEHFYDLHFGVGSLTAISFPKHLYGHEFAVWLNLAWFVKCNDNQPFITTGNDRWNPGMSSKANMAIAMHEYLRNLSTSSLTGMALYRYLVEELSIQTIIPTTTIDDEDVMGSSDIELTIQTNESLVARGAELNVAERINGIAMSMVHDMLLVLQRDTKASPLTPWALKYFDWQSLSLVDKALFSDPTATYLEPLKIGGALQNAEMDMFALYSEFVQAGANSPTASERVKSYVKNIYQARFTHGLTGLAYLFSIEYFMGLHGVDKKLPPHLAALCMPTRALTLFQAFVHKLFPVKAEDYIRAVVPWVKEGTIGRNGRNVAEIVFDGYHMVAFNFWSKLSSSVLYHWNKWIKVYLMGGYGIDEHNQVYLDPVRFSHLNLETSPQIMHEENNLGHLNMPQLLNVFALFAKLPENDFSFYARRDVTQRLALCQTINSEVDHTKIMAYMAFLRKCAIKIFTTTHGSNGSSCLFDEILDSNRFDLIHWMHDFYFSTVFPKTNVDDYMTTIEKHVQSMTQMPPTTDLEALEHRDLFARSWTAILDRNIQRAMKLGHLKVFEFLHHEYRTSYLLRNYKDIQFYTRQKHELSNWSILRVQNPSTTLEPMLWKHLWAVELGKARMNKYIHPDLPLYCGPIPLLVASIAEKEALFRNYKRRIRDKRKRKRADSTGETIERAKKKLKTIIQATQSKSSDDEDDNMDVDDGDENENEDHEEESESSQDQQAPQQPPPQQPPLQLAPAPPPHQGGNEWDDVWNDAANDFFY